MPRTKPTTIITPGVQPSTQYSKPRDGGIEPFTFDSTRFTFDSTDWTWDMTEIEYPALFTSYTTPRYGKYVEEIGGANVLDLSGELVEGISGIRTNIIDTIYT